MIDLPEKIRKIVGHEKYVVDSVGLSGSAVLLFGDKVLKVQNEGDEAENEFTMMKWLGGKVPVPKVLAHERAGGKRYLLMSRLRGEMACSEQCLNTPERLAENLANALRPLWAVDVSDCPSKINLDKKLSMALMP